MKNQCVLSIIFVIGYAVQCLATFSFFTSSSDSGMDEFMSQNYPHTRRYLADIIEKEPQNIDALYARLYVFQTEIVDYEAYSIFGGAYIQAADSLLKILDIKLKGSQASLKVRYLFFKGSILSTKALVYSKQGDWLLGAKHGLSSVTILEQVLKQDSTMKDALYFVGAYNYYLGNNLKWVPFLTDKTTKGLMQIKAATGSGTPFSFAAKTSLAWIMLERGDYAYADSLAGSLSSLYPENTLFLRLKARTEYMAGKKENALQTAEKLSILSKNRTPINWSDLLSGYQIRIAIYKEMRDYSQCHAVIEEALSLSLLIPKNIRQLLYVQKHLEYIHSVNRELRE